MMAATVRSAANRILTAMPAYIPFMVCPVRFTVPLATHSFLKTAAGGKGCFNLDLKKYRGKSPVKLFSVFVSDTVCSNNHQGHDSKDGDYSKHGNLCSIHVVCFFRRDLCRYNEVRISRIN